MVTLVVNFPENYGRRQTCLLADLLQNNSVETLYLKIQLVSFTKLVENIL